MRIVIGPIHGERLARGVDLVSLGDLEDPDSFVADEERYAAGCLHFVGPKNDRNRERGAAGEPASGDDRLVVIATEETVERRKRAGAEHEDVGQLALTDLQLRQSPSFRPKLGQLIARWQP